MILLILLALSTPAWALEILQPVGPPIRCEERDGQACCMLPQPWIEACDADTWRASRKVKAIAEKAQQSCQQRLRAALSEARAYIYAGQVEEPAPLQQGKSCKRASGHHMLPSTYYYIDRECEAEQKLNTVRQEKALAEKIDALLKECP